MWFFSLPLSTLLLLIATRLNYYKSKMSDRASNSGTLPPNVPTPPPVVSTPPPIVQVEVVIQPPIIAISPGEWTELAAVVERYVRDESIIIQS